MKPLKELFANANQDFSNIAVSSAEARRLMHHLNAINSCDVEKAIDQHHVQLQPQPA